MTLPRDADWIRVEDIQEPWLVVLDKEPAYVVACFASRSEAEARVRAQPTEIMGTETYRVRVLRDSATAYVRAGTVSVSKALDLKRRDTWLKRCAPELKDVLGGGCLATFVVWEPRVPERLLHTRFGGGGVVGRGQASPVCRNCNAVQRFVALLDFSGTEVSDRVPKQWCAVYYCMKCMPRVADSVLWFDAHDPVVKAPEATHAEFGSARTGRRCRTFDFLLHRKAHSQLSERADLPGSLLKGAWLEYLRPDGTKLGGYVNWIQFPESHRCACGSRMEYVGQIASVWNFMFADAGTLYIFVCEKAGCRKSLVNMQSF